MVLGVVVIILLSQPVVVDVLILKLMIRRLDGVRRTRTSWHRR